MFLTVFKVMTCTFYGLMGIGLVLALISMI